MNTRRHQRGFVLQEALMAVGLAMALAVGIAQLLVVVTNQRRLVRQQAVAVREAGNIMEHVAARSWDDTTRRALRSVDLSEQADAFLPDADMSIEVTDEEDDVRRISVEISWQSVPEQTKSVQLVGWKYRDREEEP